MATKRPLQVKHLRPGQRFVWAGRVVVYLHAQDHTTSRSGKKTRRLIVQDGADQHALWYADEEQVTVVRGEEV